MPSLAPLLGFLSVSLLIAASPGPSWVYTISTTLTQGRRAGLLANLGNSSGILCHALAAGFGLSLLLQYSSVAFQLLKLAGVVYLLYLALCQVRGRSLLDTGTAARRKTTRQIFFGGVAASLFNPKILLLMVALLPQFVDFSQGTADTQLALLGCGHALVAGSIHTLLVYFSGAIAARLKSSERLQRNLRWLTGSLFLAFGTRLALAQQG